MFMGKKKFLVPDYNLIAQKVGKTGKDNCGSCHFFGGGGNAVKHGDLDKSLSNPTPHYRMFKLASKRERWSRIYLVLIAINRKNI